MAMVWCLSERANGQTSYSDVAVIVNANSTFSQAIGTYFKSQRNIPDQNIITIHCSSAEEVDAAEFNSMRSQIESYLQANNLVDSINYLVTTKGVPLKINRGETCSTNSPSASVESELMCILGSYAGYIGANGRYYSPYYSKNQHFSRATQGIYLVTRLDAYTTQEVFDLIDRSGPATRVSSNSCYVLDQDPTWNASAEFLNDYMTTARNLLAERGKNVELNSDSVYVTSRKGVLGYVSWGSNDRNADNFTTHALPLNSWSPGAIVETYVSTSARSFENPPSYGQSLIADLIEEGVSGAKGYVYEPFTSSIADPSVLFDRYAAGYNLAESYFMASRYVSWMDVVIGDPKTSVQEVQGMQPVQMSFLHATTQIGSGIVELRWGTLSEMNNYGFTVQRADTALRGFSDLEGSYVAGHGTTLDPQSYTWSDRIVEPGAYFYRLKQFDVDGKAHFSEQQQVVVTGAVASVKDASLPQRFALDQNYPNPFNPVTTIGFRVAGEKTGSGVSGEETGSGVSGEKTGAGVSGEKTGAGVSGEKTGSGVSGLGSSNVRLTVYDLLGREVAVLVNENKLPGAYRVAFDGGRLASGTYFYLLQVGERIETRTMMYLK
jgi:uncharacterized protein (TIGR03790 family)